jgi:hypothetical protein
MRTWHAQKIYMHRGRCEMRCGVVVEEEGNKLFVGQRFVYFCEAERHEVGKEPYRVQHYHLLIGKNETSMARGPFSEKEVYCSEVGEKEK